MRAWVTYEKDRGTGLVPVIATFSGPMAETHAAGFIATLPGHEDGRYGLDVDHGEADPTERLASYVNEAEGALEAALWVARDERTPRGMQGRVEAARDVLKGAREALGKLKERAPSW